MQHLRTRAKSQVGSKAHALSINMTLPASTHDWLRLPSIPGRKHRVYMIQPDTKWQKFRMRIGNSGSNSIFPGLRAFSITYALCGGDDAARARCERITEHLCQVLDKCPIKETGGPRTNLFNYTIVRLAIVSAFPNMKKVADLPTFCVESPRSKARWDYNIHFINTETNAPECRGMQIKLEACEGVDPSIIPDITKLATFTRGYGREIIKMNNGRQFLPPHVEKQREYSRTVHNTAFKFACWMTSMLNDSVTSPAGLIEVVRSYKKLIGCYDGRSKNPGRPKNPK